MPVEDIYVPCSDALWDSTIGAPRLQISGIPNDGRNHFILAEGIGDSAWALKAKDYFESIDAMVWFNADNVRRVEQYAKWVGLKNYDFCKVSDMRHLKNHHCEYTREELESDPGQRYWQCNTWIENIEKVGIKDMEYPLEMPEKYPNAKWRQLKDWNSWLPNVIPTPHGKFVWEKGSKEIIFHASMATYQGQNRSITTYAKAIRRLMAEGWQVRMIGYEPKGHEGTWDIAYAEKIRQIVEMNGDKMLEPYYNCDFAFIMDKIAESAGFIGVDSGMSIMSIYMGVPTFRLYSEWLRYMPGTYEPDGHRSNWCFLWDFENRAEDIDLGIYPSVNRGLVLGLPQFIERMKAEWS